MKVCHENKFGVALFIDFVNIIALLILFIIYYILFKVTVLWNFKMSYMDNRIIEKFSRKTIFFSKFCNRDLQVTANII